MHHFIRINGVMHAENVPLATVAASVGTPVYIYSSATLTRHFTLCRDALSGMDSLIAYAVKACSAEGVLALLASLGAGADTVSGGELVRALRAGIRPEKTVFSGVGKTREEMRLALQHGIKCFNVESMEELETLAAVARECGRIAPVSIRVNPDIGAGGHEKTITGRKGDKFGVAAELVPAAYAHIAGMDGLQAVGIDMHIGSQTGDLAAFDAALARIFAMARELRSQGHDITHVDVGGGLGAPYAPGDIFPSPARWAESIATHARGSGFAVIMEPGRVIAANAGILLTRVIRVKRTAEKRFIIVDAAMNDLIRPTLYDAWHSVETVMPPVGALTPADIVGPICESGDYMAKERPMPEVAEGDLLAIMSAGAYGAVMASTYNSRPLCPEVLARGDDFAVIRRRMGIEEQLALESVPVWPGDRGS